MAPRGKHTPYTYRVWSLSVVQLYIRIHVHVLYSTGHKLMYIYMYVVPQCTLHTSTLYTCVCVGHDTAQAISFNPLPQSYSFVACLFVSWDGGFLGFFLLLSVCLLMYMCYTQYNSMYIQMYMYIHVHVHGRMTSVVISSCSILCVLTARNRLRDGATMKRRGWPTVRETTRL